MTYTCAHCRAFAACELDDLDTGTTLTCNKCGKDTVIVLMHVGGYETYSCSGGWVPNGQFVYDEQRVTR